MKEKILIIILIGCFWINVNAGDTHGPSVVVIVDNKDGAFCYEKKYDSENDKTIYVKTQKKYNYQENRRYDFSIFDSKYLKFDSKGYYNYDSDCYIDLKDIKLVPPKIDDNYNIDNYIKCDNLKATLLTGEVELKKGVSYALRDAFSTITKIISGEVFNYKCCIFNNFYYVSYGNYEGWINDNNIFAYEDKDDNVIIYPNDNTIYDINDNVIGIIPKNEEVTEYLKLSNGGYYVNYNGNKGIIKHGFAKTIGKLKIMGTSNLYKDFNGKELLKQVNDGEYDFNILFKTKGDWNSSTRAYLPSENAWLIVNASWSDYGGSYHDDGEIEIINEEKIKSGRKNNLFDILESNNIPEMKNNDKDDEIIKIQDNCLHEEIKSNNNLLITILVIIIVLITIAFTIILIKIKKTNVIKKV